MTERHKWVERNRVVDRTERQCMKCGLWKITRHERDADPPHWVEWYRGKIRVPGDLTPQCTGAQQAEARAGEAGTSAPMSRDSASASSSVPQTITD